MNKAKVALEPLATKVFSFVGDMAESFGNVLPGILDGVGAAFNKVVTVIGPIVSAIGDAIKLVIGSFTGSGAEIGKESSGFINFFVDIGATARDTIDKIIEVIKSIDFTAIAKGIGDFLAPLLPAIKELVTNGFDLIVTAVTVVIQLFKDNQATIEGIANVLRGALLGAITAVSAVFGFLADHMGLVKAIIIPLMAAFAAYEVVVGVISVATTIWTAAQAALNIVMALNPIGLVIAAIVALVAGIIYAYTHFEGFRNVVDTVWQVLVTAFNWVKDNWPLILAILTGPIGVAVLEIAKHWDTIKNGVSAMVDAVVGFLGNLIGFFTALPGRILDAIGGLGSLLVSKGIELIQGFIEGYIGMWAAVIQFYISIPGWIVGFIGNVASLLVGKGVDTIQGLISGFTSMFGSIASTIGSIGGSVVSWIGDAYSWLVSKGADVIRGFIDGIVSWIGSIAGHISGIAGNVRSSIGDAISWLYEAGKDIIRGLINGVQDMVGAARDKVVSVARGLKDAALGALGIGSPSKVFHEIGLNVGQGLVNGLDASRSMVGKSGEELANAAIMAASRPLTLSPAGLPGQGALVGAAAPSGAAGGLSGASYEINQVFNNANVDAREVSRELSWALLTRGR
jgi:phage-related protein